MHFRFFISFIPLLSALVSSAQDELPIWYERKPGLGEYDLHRSTYLYCKQAHGGHDQWLVADADKEGECSKCFCLPDTQRIGCMRTECNEKRPVLRRNTKAMTGYVNHEACVRANNGRTFTRGNSRCVCHQDGAVICTPIR
ncbi:hypothetical protein LPJ60_004987 [Coemansia sp. RSA 2675]|nr:hypothetical protein LPJ60_004987 [Coemansia sp. RSA 2675]